MKLNIPYVEQFNDYACGAASLEMVYSYYGLSDIDQKGIFEKYKEVEPTGSEGFRIATGDLVDDARSRNFESDWGIVEYNNVEKSIKVLESLLKQGIPVIVCQQFTKSESQIGHFRVVFGVDKENIYFHDPHPKFGGVSIKWTHNEFVDFWQPTGPNVWGGVYLWIKKKK